MATHGRNDSTPQERRVRPFNFESSTGRLSVLDQTLLPREMKYVGVENSEQGYRVIKNMMVRGAPCIAAVGCLSIIAELNQPKYLNDDSFTVESLLTWLRERSLYLIGSRPTAVNLRNALDKLNIYAETNREESKNSTTLIHRLTQYCVDAIKIGEALNKQLGDYGADELSKVLPDCVAGISVLTHCNTGALATVGYGTAIGVIRSLRNKGKLKHVYCTETRPYNQGSRLTAWELLEERIPVTLIADSMVASLMATNKIDAVLVGADCVACNGDTANKIGTLQIAIVANHYRVPFYVAAPTQSIDTRIENESSIPIEFRPGEELRCIGGVALAPTEIDTWNPCFDVTPANLITGVITEFGVCETGRISEFVASEAADSCKGALF